MPALVALAAPSAPARGGAGASTSGTAACTQGCRPAPRRQLVLSRRGASVTQRTQAVQAPIKDAAVLTDVAKLLERALERAPADALGAPAAWRAAERIEEAALVACFDCALGEVPDGGPPAARRVAERAVEAAQVASFEEMVRASDVTLVDFQATWCGPCQLMSKALAPIASEMKGQVSVVKVDTDQFPKLASRYKIKALPTLLLFREGCAVDRVEGFMAQALLAKRVRYYAGRMDKKFGRQ